MVSPTHSTLPQPAGPIDHVNCFCFLRYELTIGEIGSGVATGILPETLVPAPGEEITASSPPSADSRSAIPCSPVPWSRASGSKPMPSSATSKWRWLSPRERWTLTPLAVLGQTALFFYLLHVHVLTLGAHLLGAAHRGGLPATYAASLVVVVLLYPLCAWYRDYKQARPNGWPRYV